MIFQVLDVIASQPSIWTSGSSYSSVHLCIAVQYIAYLVTDANASFILIVMAVFMAVLIDSEAEQNNPGQNRSLKFSVGLPQPQGAAETRQESECGGQRSQQHRST